ncbi:MAG: hypothetical protein L0Z70_00210 [Chloroflexi bacterium]|nr:hypothetical protein [Chloroflexota bacterium]
MKPIAARLFRPEVVTLLCLAALAAGVLIQSGGAPLAFARLGTLYSEGQAEGTQGYDGQFVYYIASDLNPATVAAKLDAPAYRYQRILMPLAARLLSFGSADALPWVLIALGILSQAAGVWAVSELLAGWGISRWYALIYGLWAGFMLATRLDLPEPLAYALAAGGLLAIERGKLRWSWALLGLALFAKEVTILFLAAALLAALIKRQWGHIAGLLVVALLPFVLFQAWLWMVFGQAGIASGGAMATPFEAIPFMGLLRIGQYSLVYLAAMAVVFVPAVVLPSIWGVWAAAQDWLRGRMDLYAAGLLVNGLAMAFLPFSTYRETGGLLRFACGLVLAVLLYLAQRGLRKGLRYSSLWLVLNVFLLKS